MLRPRPTILGTVAVNHRPTTQHRPPTIRLASKKYRVTVKYAVLRIVGLVQRRPLIPARIRHR
jgi:hypothetical protein